MTVGPGPPVVPSCLNSLISGILAGATVTDLEPLGESGPGQARRGPALMTEARAGERPEVRAGEGSPRSAGLAGEAGVLDRTGWDRPSRGHAAVGGDPQPGLRQRPGAPVVPSPVAHGRGSHDVACCAAI